MGAKPPRSSSFSFSIDWLSLEAGVGSFGAASSVVGTASDCESAGEGTAVLSSPEEDSASTAANKPPLIFEGKKGCHLRRDWLWERCCRRMCECVGFLQEQDTVGESYLQMLKAMLHAQISVASQARLRRPC